MGLLFKFFPISFLCHFKEKYTISPIHVLIHDVGFGYFHGS